MLKRCLKIESLALATALFVACEGPMGPAGPTGPEGPANVLTQADLIGTWAGDVLIENSSGTAFTSAGTRTVTFNADGTYTSDILVAVTSRVRTW